MTVMSARSVDRCVMPCSLSQAAMLQVEVALQKAEVNQKDQLLNELQLIEVSVVD